MTKLTSKQELFCLEYMVDLNATQAAIRAGYSENSAGAIGGENLQKPEIQERIQELKAERASKVLITAEDVLKNIIAIGDRCMQKEPVMVDGEPSGDFKFDPSNALKANELLGKHLAIFTEKVKVEGELGVKHSLSTILEDLDGESSGIPETKG